MRVSNNRCAVVGAGRIGRHFIRQQVARQIHDQISGIQNPYSIGVIADIEPIDAIAGMLQHDSVYGRLPQPMSVIGDALAFGVYTDNGRVVIRYHQVTKESPLKYGDYGCDLAVDCTGRATKREVAETYLADGAKHVLVSAPPKTKEDADHIVIINVNDHHLFLQKDKIISLASCTTNALAPIVRLVDRLGITSGRFTTVHAYTASQRLVDTPAKDFGDSFAAAQNIIVSETGAAKAIGWLMPHLEGRITGIAARVPVPSGSLLDAHFVVENPLPTVELQNWLRSETSRLFKGSARCIEGQEAQMPSSYFLGMPESSIIVLPLADVTGNLVRVVAWYDNEYSYSCRLHDATRAIFAQLNPSGE